MKLKHLVIFIVLSFLFVACASVGAAETLRRPHPQQRTRPNPEAVEKQRLQQRLRILRSGIENLKTMDPEALRQGESQEKKIAGMLPRLLAMQSELKKAMSSSKDSEQWKEMQKESEKLMKDYHNAQLRQRAIAARNEPHRDASPKKSPDQIAFEKKIQEARKQHESGLAKLKERNAIPVLDAPSARKPHNDSCSKATAVGVGNYSVDTTNATNDGSESCTASSSPDVWYEFTSPVTGPISVDTFGSDFDTVLSVHDPVCPGTSANEISCNNDCPSGGTDSCLNINAVAGSTYLIRLGGNATDAGVAQLHIAFPAAISGTVTDSSNSAPVPNVEIDIYDSNGNWTNYSYTDASGNYAVPSLPTGTYYARTNNYTGFIDELYDDIPCASGCTVTTGTPINVTEGISTSGIDFVLKPYGRITGKITRQSDGQPVPYPSVDIFDSDGNYAAYGYSDANGNYSANYLPTGTYYAKTYSSYFDELYNNIPCENTCDLSLGTPIAVTFGSTTANINFALSAGGTISGTVKDAISGAPLLSSYVDIYNSTGNSNGYAYVDATGAYQAIGLTTGNYYVIAHNYDGYLDELYNNIPCPDFSCNPITGTAVAVTFGNDTGGINFALDQAGKISGKVTNATGGALPSVGVDIYDSGGNWASFGYTDSAGNYTASNLRAGNYFAKTNAPNSINELYDNIPCDPDCVITSGTPIPVTVNNTTSGINFALDSGGRITGKITLSTTAAALEGIEVRVYNSSGNLAGSGYSNATGKYSVAGLSTGTYFARTSNYDGYINELYNNIACEGCDPTTGTPIAVQTGATKKNINFVLDRAGSITGTITDTNNVPLDYIEVDIYDSTGNWQSYAYTDASGVYSTSGLLNGNYFARTYSYSGGYIDELYNNIPCSPDCDVTTGTPIAVSVNSTTTANFKLSTGGHIAGTITSVQSSQPLENIYLTIYDSNGDYVSYGYTDGLGHYDAGGLLTGNYFVSTDNYQGYIDELYDNQVCEPYCDVTGGTPVAVTFEATTGGIDFALNEGGKISGNVSSADGPLSSVSVDVYDSNGDYVAGAYTDFEGNYLAEGLMTGQYYATTSSYSNYLDELYNNFPCEPYCDVTTGTAISVTAGQTTPGIMFVLAKGGKITGKVTDAGTSALLSDITIYVYDSNGDYVDSAYSNVFGLYSIGGLTTGNYYARTHNYSGYANEIYNNIPCVGDCNVLSGNAISVTAGSVTSSINFALAVGGKITGTVTDASTANPIEYPYVDIYDNAGNLIAYGYADASGMYEVEGLQTSSYYAVASAYDYVSELYNGITCPGGNCDVTTGNAVAVTVGSTTSDIDFSLDQGGRISGTVLDTDNAGIADINLEIYDAAGEHAGWSYTDSDGSYQVSGLAAGNYYVRTESFGSYDDELYDNIPCGGGACTPTDGSAVAVASGLTTSGIDFVLNSSTGGTVLFGDDFEDGTKSVDWTYKGKWSESGGSLVGSSAKKGTTIASPAFTGCDNCTIHTTMNTTGGTHAYISLLGWYQDSANYVDLAMKQDIKKWILRQHVGGVVVAKTLKSQTIRRNVTYDVRLRFDGNQFTVYVDDVLIITLDKAASSAPTGTVGYVVKETKGTFGEIEVTAP